MRENGKIYVPETMLVGAIVLAKGMLGIRGSGWTKGELNLLTKAVEVQFEPVKVARSKDINKEFISLILTSETGDWVKTIRNHILSSEDADISKHLLKTKWVIGVLHPKKS